MQFLYTLTSTFRDYYYEQFLLSATSLKLIMPGAEITLLCDSETKKNLTDIKSRREYEKLVFKTITIDAPADFNQIEVSRWVRTSMRQHVSGDFLFLDGDTIVTDDLSSVFRMGIIFGACQDKHSQISKHQKKENIIKNNEYLGFNSPFSDKHFNGGVLFCANLPEVHKLFERWNELWLFSRKKNILRDQPALNMAIYENSSLFTELDGTWNCQIACNGLPFLANSKIIHYFATDTVFQSSPFLFASDSIYKSIKETGTIPKEILELLQKPKSAFIQGSRIVAGTDILNVLDSNFFTSIFLLYKKFPCLFNFFNKLSSVGKKITKSYLVKKSKKTDGGTIFYN